MSVHLYVHPLYTLYIQAYVHPPLLGGCTLYAVRLEGEIA